MLIRNTQLTQNNSKVSETHPSVPSSNPQHGIHILPAESLTHITSHLDPKSLLVLAQVDIRLNQLINDDYTWHRAFVCQYFGIERDLYNAKCLLLRRSNVGSWKQEFILYYSLRRRWQRSRNTTTAHIPLHSAVSNMHLLPSHGLIASSLRYGVVSRSLPFTGRVLRGFLDAAGSGTGLGIGNPNTEFTPNVSACALGSDGGTAKIAWGFRNGELAFTSANKAMDAGSRSAAKFTRCPVDDVHQGIVSDVIWDGNFVVSAGTDGRVKLWDPKRARCIWTSGGPVVQDQCIKVAAAINKGIIAGAKRSGIIVVWTGFTSDVLEGRTSVATLTISSPVEDADSHPVSSLHIDGNATSPVLLVAFADSILFYRFDIDPTTGVVDCKKFGDAALGPITSLAPFFTEQASEYSLVIAGTQFGCIGIYDWTTPSNPLPTYKLEAYEDGAAVTALAWNGLTLVTGCARGTTKVFDALTLEHIRSFPSPVPRRRTAPAFAGGPLPEDPAVRQILLGAERDVLFVAVGDHVMAWRAGPVPKGGYRSPAKNSAGKRRERGEVSSKAYQHIEMRQAIVESKYILEDESRNAQRVYSREREHRAQLDSLGLDEVEAVEYVLMLSREEAIEREQPRGQLVDEGVFEGDFDLDETRPPSSGSSASSTGFESSPHHRRLVSAHNSRPSTSNSNSSSKLQVSQPLRAEPTGAFFSPPLSRTSAAGPSAKFPPISGSISPVGPGAKRSAWSTPLTRSPVPSPGTSVGGGGISQFSASTNIKKAEDEMDDEIQLAIALSLSQMK